jgi:hypothetical protein
VIDKGWLKAARMQAGGLFFIAGTFDRLKADGLAAALNLLGRGDDIARFDDEIAHRSHAFGHLNPAFELVHEDVGTSMSAFSHALNIFHANQRDVPAGVVKFNEHDA